MTTVISISCLKLLNSNGSDLLSFSGHGLRWRRDIEDHLLPVQRSDWRAKSILQWHFKDFKGNPRIFSLGMQELKKWVFCYLNSPGGYAAEWARSSTIIRGRCSWRCCSWGHARIRCKKRSRSPCQHILALHFIYKAINFSKYDDLHAWEAKALLESRHIRIQTLKYYSGNQSFIVLSIMHYWFFVLKLTIIYNKNFKQIKSLYKRIIQVQGNKNTWIN